MGKWECADTCTDLWASPPPGEGNVLGGWGDYVLEGSADMETITEGEHHKERVNGTCEGWGSTEGNKEGTVIEGSGYDSSPYVSVFKTEEMYKEIEVIGSDGVTVKKTVNDGIKVSSTLFHAVDNGKFFHSAMPTMYKRWCRWWGGNSYVPSVSPASQGFYGLPWVFKDKYDTLLVPFFMVINIRSDREYTLTKGMTADGKEKNLYFQFDILSKLIAADLGAKDEGGSPMSIKEGGLSLQSDKLMAMTSAQYDLWYQYTDNVTPYTVNWGLINDIDSATGTSNFLWPRKVCDKKLNIELAIWMKPNPKPLSSGLVIKSQHLMSSLKARLVFEMRKVKLFYREDPGPGGTDPSLLLI